MRPLKRATTTDALASAMHIGEAMSKWSKRGRGLYDNGDWTISAGSDYFSDGSHNPFRVTVYHRRGGKPTKRYGVRVPLIRFRTAYKFRKLGLLAIYKWQSHTVYQLFNR